MTPKFLCRRKRERATLFRPQGRRRRKMGRRWRRRLLLSRTIDADTATAAGFSVFIGRFPEVLSAMPARRRDHA